MSLENTWPTCIGSPTQPGSGSSFTDDPARPRLCRAGPILPHSRGGWNVPSASDSRCRAHPAELPLAGHRMEARCRIGSGHGHHRPSCLGNAARPSQEMLLSGGLCYDPGVLNGRFRPSRAGACFPIFRLNPAAYNPKINDRQGGCGEKNQEGINGDHNLFSYYFAHRSWSTDGPS
jgi:hypothetical protein